MYSEAALRYSASIRAYNTWCEAAVSIQLAMLNTMPSKPLFKRRTLERYSCQPLSLSSTVQGFPLALRNTSRASGVPGSLSLRNSKTAMASASDCAVSVRLSLRLSESVMASALDRTGCSCSLLGWVALLACCLGTFFLLALSLEATAGDFPPASALLSSCSRSRLRESCSIMIFLNSSISLSETLYRALYFVHSGKPAPVYSHEP